LARLSETIRQLGITNVEHLTWSEAVPLFVLYSTVRVVDVRTGTYYYMYVGAKSGNDKTLPRTQHVDVDPSTRGDTATFHDTFNNVHTWTPRPVFVTIFAVEGTNQVERTIAASIHGMPHADSFTSDNGMVGHVCIHFQGTVTNSTDSWPLHRAATVEGMLTWEDVNRFSQHCCYVCS